MEYAITYGIEPCDELVFGCELTKQTGKDILAYINQLEAEVERLTNKCDDCAGCTQEPPSKKKKCGKCNKIDGRLYLSNPPEVKCTITGRYHCLDEECDITSDDNPELLKGGDDNE